jgi:hypothetical protein
MCKGSATGGIVRRAGSRTARQIGEQLTEEVQKMMDQSGVGVMQLLDIAGQGLQAGSALEQPLPLFDRQMKSDFMERDLFGRDSQPSAHAVAKAFAGGLDLLADASRAFLFTDGLLNGREIAVPQSETEYLERLGRVDQESLFSLEMGETNERKLA